MDEKAEVVSERDKVCDTCDVQRQLCLSSGDRVLTLDEIVAELFESGRKSAKCFQEDE